MLNHTGQDRDKELLCCTYMVVMRAPKIANHGRNQLVSEEGLGEATCNQ